MKLNAKRWVWTLLLIVVSTLLAYQGFADPIGGTLTNYSTDTGPTFSIPNRTDARGTITTVLFDSTQQNQNWKAYVGNVSGGVALRDSSSNTIYDWSLTTIAGEVYATNVSADFTTANCTMLAAEYSGANTFYSIAQGAVDTINATFNDTAHADFDVGATSFTDGDCPSIALWNGTKQNPSATAPFQEMLIKDDNNAFVYVSRINDDVVGFDARTYDFEMIVPEVDTGAATTYYFYIELTT